MGLFGAIKEKVTGLETVAISWEQMVELVRVHYIAGADDAFLKQVKKTAKSVTFQHYTINTLDTASGRYRLTVYPIIGSFMILLLGKSVSLTDREEKKDYKIPGRKWKKFYKGVVAAIEAEKAGR